MIQQLHSFALSPSLFFLLPAGQDVSTPDPGKPIEREIAGGETYAYQIRFATSQFLRGG